MGHAWVTACLLSVAIAVIPMSPPAQAEPRELPAAVVWRSGDRVYLVARDSTALATHLRITFQERGHAVASGEIIRLLESTLAEVRLDTGTLARVKKLDHLRVLGEPVPLERVSLLRVGYPSGTRANLAFDCPGMAPRPPSFYGVTALAPDTYRLVRHGGPVGVPWPDTMLVHLYAQSDDEEIALERDEMDVAVFWPGECSERVREDPRWRDAPLGLRARGVIAATGSGAGVSETTLRDDPMLAALDPQMFGGDLLPWAALDSATAARGEAGAESTHAGAATGAAAGYAVDTSMPGRRVLERFLNRGAETRAPDIRLVYLDAPLAARDSLRAEWRARGIVPFYAIRTPVLCGAKHRTLVRALGAGTFADLCDCAARGGRP
ncbi:MAG: hypothetical protein ACHQ52_11950 [Candidatus Eisenbacteria bacterium]